MGKLQQRVLVGLLAVTLALGFQFLTVRYNYGGDWTALFYSGGRFTQPRTIPTAYRFAGSFGYDGQFYRLIAHDPGMRADVAQYLDDPRYRYTRILVPALAYALVLGNHAFIDFAYIAVILCFTFGGAYWMAALAQRRGWRVWTGLAFLLAPATLIGIERLTIDVAMAALCVAFVVLRRASAGWLVALAGAALCRETGYLLIAAGCGTLLYKRQWRDSLWTALTAVPAVAWTAWVTLHIAARPMSRMGFIPLAGWLTRLAHPLPYGSLEPVWAGVTQVLDYAALAGVAVGLWCFWRLRWRAELVVLALPVVFVNLPDVWSDVYAFGRTMTPFWLLLAMRGAERRMWLALVPIALMDVRIGWQWGPQMVGIIKGLVT